MLAIKEETLWRQRSWIRWLKEEDRKTKFFHQMASHRSNLNVIHELLIDGILTKNQVTIRDHVESYYTKLFKEEVPFRPCLDDMTFDRISIQEKKIGVAFFRG